MTFIMNLSLDFIWIVASAGLASLCLDIPLGQSFYGAGAIYCIGLAIRKATKE